MTSKSCCFCSLLYIFILFSSLIIPRTILAEDFNGLIQQFPGSIRRVSERILPVDDHGAVGNGTNDDTEAFKFAWAVACASATPTRIVISPKKTYLLHPISLGGPCQSKVFLQISGRIIAPEDPEVWNGLNPHKWLYFHGVKHLTVNGGGEINGMGRKWWDRSCKTNPKNPCRPSPTAITFHRCKYLKVSNLKLVDSQKMHLAITKSMRVKVTNLKVIAPRVSPNTDGIHISSSQAVDVLDSTIKTGDDCISIVSNSSRIRVRNIICGPGHGISIGSLGKRKSWSEIRDIIVDGVVLSNTDNGVRIKTWQGGGGIAKDIAFKNVKMQNVSNPIIINQYYCDSFLPCPNQTLAVKVTNVTYAHIKGTSATENAMIFKCSDGAPCEGLYMEDVELLSAFGGVTSSFCWKAYGSTFGLIYPLSCLTQINDDLIRKKMDSGGLSSL